MFPSRVEIFYHPIFDFFQKNRFLQQPLLFAPSTWDLRIPRRWQVFVLTESTDPCGIPCLRKQRPILKLENPVQTCYVSPVTFLPSTDLWSENRRRSKRVKARIPVVVRFQDSNKRFISEMTHTVIVNEHGALILLAASAEVDQIIRLENPNRERNCSAESPAWVPASWVRRRLQLNSFCRRLGFGTPALIRRLPV